MNTNEVMIEKKIPRIDWLDYLKAFALLGVILNHLVEEIAPGSWFVRPSGIWAVFLEQVPIFLTQNSFPVSVVKILAWIGDFSPGVFILASGLGLTWAVLYQDQNNIDWKKFLQRRLLRLFPLYILLHMLFLAASLAKNGSTTDYLAPNFLLSMLGIRITDGLFFYINPAWWFVWLILQLYIVFPFLYILLGRLGIGRFLFVAGLFTFLSRLSGLVGFRYSESSYYWMLGIFFGTRLIEFCVGMALAVMMKEGARKQSQQQLWEPKRIFLYSVLLLFFGLVSFFIRFGNLVDYFFVTLGLSGVFYSIWKVAFEKSNKLSHLVTVLGSGSYGIYLVHYLVIRFVGQFFSGEWRPMGIVVAIMASFPIGIYLSRLMNLFVQKWILGIRTPFPLPAWMRAPQTIKLPLLEDDRIMINADTVAMKLYTLYSSPNHRDGVVHHARTQAEADDEYFDGKTMG